MLPSLEGIPARPPRQAHFGIRSVDPVHPLSTLQTPRHRDAWKTCSWPVCSTLARPDFHLQVAISFPNALPHVLIQQPDGDTHKPLDALPGSFWFGLSAPIPGALMPPPRLAAYR
jgi:hypothetical protein